MNKKTIALVAAALLAGETHAHPLETIGLFLMKVLKSGTAKEVWSAERSAGIWFRTGCAFNEERRMSDKFLDSSCGAADGRSLYVGNIRSEVYLPYRSDFLK